VTTYIGLLGRNIGYSLSPAIQSAALKAVNLNWEYLVLDTEPDNLPEVVDKLRRPNWVGANVTVPYKEIILPLLDEVHCDAQAVGAVNTIVSNGGKLVGYNTDITGLARDLRRLNIELAHRDVIIVGAGGGAAAALALTKDCHRVTICCRNQQQGIDLAQRLALSAQVVPWLTLPACDLLINCSPPNSGWQKLGQGAKKIYDLNYLDLPQGNYHSGLGMLVYQGVEAFRMWTGWEPIQAMAEAVGLKGIEI